MTVGRYFERACGRGAVLNDALLCWDSTTAVAMKNCDSSPTKDRNRHRAYQPGKKHLCIEPELYPDVLVLCIYFLRFMNVLNDVCITAG